jgi:hypothetical protein
MGRLGNLKITARLVELEPVGETLVVGDLHGDIDRTRSLALLTVT